MASRIRLRGAAAGDGQIEWFDGRDLAVYTNRPRLFARLWAISGVRRHQTGDAAMRATFAPEALEEVATVIQARQKRTQTSPRSLGNLRSRATSQAQAPLFDDGTGDRSKMTELLP